MGGAVAVLLFYLLHPKDRFSDLLSSTKRPFEQEHVQYHARSRCSLKPQGRKDNLGSVGITFVPLRFCVRQGVGFVRQLIRAPEVKQFHVLFFSA